MTHPASPGVNRTDQPSPNAAGSTTDSGRPVFGRTLPVEGSERRRLGRAFGASMVTHVAMFLLVTFVVSRLPAPQTALLGPDLSKYEIVWLPIEGPGGGGGGGGDETPEPPAKVELPGPEKVSVPVEEAPKLEPPEPPKEEPEPEPEQRLNIPALTLGASERTVAGVLEDLPSVDPLARGPGTGGGAGTGTGTGIGEGRGSGLGPGEGGGAGGGVYRLGSGIEPPRVVREVKPQYTADAMRAKVQGVVWVEAVVQPDGTVGEVHVTRSLDPVFGLDQEAVRAVRQWRFVPGMRMGQPVPVLVSVELTFTLR